MQSVRNKILSHVRVRVIPQQWSLHQRASLFKKLQMGFCAATDAIPEHIMNRVIGLVKKFDKIEANKVTETAYFQQDLCLDSLDRVELVMAFEEEFDVVIPDEEADKLLCCADVARFISSANRS
ncbi:Acyl carrier protein 3, mitochondrial [Linum grandiflorum]